MDMNEIKEKRTKVEHQLIIRVLGKRGDKSLGGIWAGKEYFRLKVDIEQPQEARHLKQIFAFKERITDEAVWKEIMDDDYFDKRKLAICSKYSNSYSLIRWRDRPLNNNLEREREIN